MRPLKCIGLRVKYRYSCQSVMKFGYLERISKITPISNFMKIHLVGAEVFHADGQTDMTTVAINFLNFANAPSMGSPALNT